MKYVAFVLLFLVASVANAQYTYQVCVDGNCRVASSVVNPMLSGYSLAPGETIVAINGQPVQSTNYQTFQASPVVVYQSAPRTVYRQFYQYRSAQPYVKTWTGPFGVTHSRTVWR